MPRLENDLARWDRRIERAKDLAATYSFAAELLRFYAQVAGFQKSLVAALKPAPASRPDPAEARPFRECLDLPALVPNFPALLSLVRQVGTPVLSQAAEEIAGEDPAYWEYLLSAYWRNEAHGPEEMPAAYLFFARAFLQPYAESFAQRRAMNLPRFGPSHCPICGAKPQVGVLREEGHGAKRSLVCSLCLTEWDYRRIICPACGEDRFDKLASYTAGQPALAGQPAAASQFDYIRVEACDTCKAYITTVDLTKNGLAIPVVDELAAVPLDLWAREQGYTKLQPNLLGM